MTAFRTILAGLALGTALTGGALALGATTANADDHCGGRPANCCFVPRCDKDCCQQEHCDKDCCYKQEQCKKNEEEQKIKQKQAAAQNARTVAVAVAKDGSTANANASTNQNLNQNQKAENEKKKGAAGWGCGKPTCATADATVNLEETCPDGKAVNRNDNTNTNKID
jgi:hypothetical protein